MIIHGTKMLLPLGARKKVLTPRMKEYLALRKRNYTQAEIAKMWNCSLYNVQAVSFRAKGRVEDVEKLKLMMNGI